MDRMRVVQYALPERGKSAVWVFPFLTFSVALIVARRVEQVTRWSGWIDVVWAFGLGASAVVGIALVARVSGRPVKRRPRVQCRPMAKPVSEVCS